MARRQHRIVLTAEQRTELRTLTTTGSRTALAFQHARILLVADEALPGRRRRWRLTDSRRRRLTAVVSEPRQQFAQFQHAARNACNIGAG